MLRLILYTYLESFATFLIIFWKHFYFFFFHFLWYLNLIFTDNILSRKCFLRNHVSISLHLKLKLDVLLCKFFGIFIDCVITICSKSRFFSRGEFHDRRLCHLNVFGNIFNSVFLYRIQQI